MQGFAFRVFRERGFNERLIRLVAVPSGKGSGKQHVLDKLQEQVRAIQNSRAGKLIIVMIDADSDSVDETSRDLDKRLPDNAPREKLVYWIPKRHIETWAKFLIEQTAVDETADYHNWFDTRFRTKGSEAYKLMARRFLARPPGAPPSLQLALDNWGKLALSP